MKNRIIILGKAASGKDFFQKQLVFNGWTPLKQYTTRPKRPNESGDEYHFVSEKNFKRKIKKLNSVQCFNEWMYGFDIEEMLSSDVMIFSPANFFSLINSSDIRIKNLLLTSMIIYLDIDEETRRKRLSERYVGGTEDDSLERRIQADAKDFEYFDSIDWNENPDGIIRLCTETEVDDFLEKLLS